MTGRRRSSSASQLELEMKTPLGWGGKREGAGRKKSSGTTGVSNKGREPHSHRHPVHVTMRVLRSVGHLRAKKPFAVIGEAIRLAADASETFRIVHFSVQSNHLHLIVEADDARALGRGMQGLSIRIARGLNRLLHRKGQVFADRYHRHDLTTRRETRFGVAYVLQNFRKHSMQRGERCPPGWIDGCSSAPWFELWARAPVTPRPSEPSPVAKPTTWMLRAGWQLY